MTVKGLIKELENLDSDMIIGVVQFNTDEDADVFEATEIEVIDSSQYRSKYDGIGGKFVRIS
jgi:hypothetical protein